MSYESVFDAIAAKAPKPKNEKLDADGVHRCAVCGEKTRSTVKVFGKVREVPCNCACIRAENEQWRRRLDEEEHERKRSVCFSQSRMSRWTFENDDRKNQKLSDAMARYADSFRDFLEEGRGLLLFGDVGTGKSYYAACIANRVIDHGYSALMTNFARLTNDLQCIREDRNAYIDGLNRYQLLIIDDLGAERKSEYMQELVFSIIDSRYRSGLPLIVTTNLTGEQLKSPGNLESERIYDRIVERCFPVQVSGASRRRAEYVETYNDMKNRLGL